MIHDSFNDNCTGAKRDVPALRMKLKNLKAQNKKMKLNQGGETMETCDESQESEQDNVGDGSVEQSVVSFNLPTKWLQGIFFDEFRSILASSPKT